MKKIDIETWDRKEIYQHFEPASHPFYVITFTADISSFYKYVKANNCSFYYSFIYLCTQAINSIENFRYVIRSGEIYLLDKRSPSFTDMHKNSELFHIVTMPIENEGIKEFCEKAAQKSSAQKCFLDKTTENDSLIYYSCTPTLYLTALTNERNYINPLERESNIPVLAWGKYIDNNGKIEMNISIEVNHRFIDGIHIAKFAKQLENLMNSL